MGFGMVSNKNLLIIHQGALGDFVLIFPAILRLHGFYEDIDVLCLSGLGRLAKSLGLVKNCYPLESAYVATLFTDDIHPKVRSLLTSYAKIILFSQSTGLGQRIRQITSKQICRLETKPPPDVHLHLTEYVLENLVSCQLIEKTDAVSADIPQYIRPEFPNKILLHPGAGSIRKRWPLFNFLEVETILKAKEMNPEFILGPAEENLAGELPGPGRTVHILSDMLDLAKLLKSAGGYIGNDSGATHLAAFLGVPTVAIFGPTDPGRWAPAGSAVEVVRPGLACHPCFETEAGNCEDPNCLEKTTPQKVIEAFYRIYPVF
jgi:ADP-heptose:LPS heptosyltransferase